MGLNSNDITETANRILFETVFHTQLGKWRYSKGLSAQFLELWFDCVPYVDLLLRDTSVKNGGSRAGELQKTKDCNLDLLAACLWRRALT
jgi:hypothetical protein